MEESVTDRLLFAFLGKAKGEKGVNLTIRNKIAMNELYRIIIKY